MSVCGKVRASPVAVMTALRPQMAALVDIPRREQTAGNWWAWDMADATQEGDDM